jgi:hypothetical protein
LKSPEDFIEKVATKSIAGHSYNVVIDEKQTIALSEWLREELARYRGGNNTSGKE